MCTSQQRWFVYILRSKNTGRHYIGRSRNPQARVEAHNAGRTKSTRRGIPWEIIYVEECVDSKAATTRERQIKSYKSGAAFQSLLGSASQGLPGAKPTV